MEDDMAMTNQENEDNATMADHYNRIREEFLFVANIDLFRLDPDEVRKFLRLFPEAQSALYWYHNDIGL